MDITKRIIKRRVDLILTSPFFGSQVLQLDLIKDENCPTMWTDGNSIGFNPSFINELSDDEIKGILAHEVLHCVFHHTTRRKNRNHIIWNIACDYAINLELIESNFALPKGGMIDKKFKGMSADQIYDLIYEELKDKYSGKNKGKGNGKDNKGSDPGGCGEVRDSKESDKGEIERKWKISAKQGLLNSKGIGDISAGLRRIVQEKLDPKASCIETLRKFVEMTARNDYTWIIPNKRYVSSGIYLPTLRSEELGKIIIAIDTSGSINNRTLAQIQAEVQEIIRIYKVNLFVIYCDSAVVNTQKFTAYDEVKLKAKGGGGTSFKPVFDYVEKHSLEPKCLIYFTDMYCNDKLKTPDFPVLWVRTDKTGKKFPFGEMIDL